MAGDKLTPDEPSELAMALSAKLQGTEDFTVLATEIDQLTAYESNVLERTARKKGWRIKAAPGWGKVIFRRAALSASRERGE